MKIKEKAEIWHQKIFKNEEISWKEELSHPWIIEKFDNCMVSFR